MNKLHLTIYSGIYAVIFTFCLYKNIFGAMLPLLVITTFVYLFMIGRETGNKLVREDYFLLAAAFLLSVSQLFTTRPFINFFNVVAIFILLFIIVLHQFSFNKEWPFIQKAKNLLLTMTSGITRFFAPFIDLSNSKASRKDENAKPANYTYLKVIITLVGMLPLFIIINLLLVSADPVYKQFVGNLTDFDLNFLDIFGTLIVTLVCFFFSYGMIVRMTESPFNKEIETVKPLDSVIPITVTTVLDIVYVIFSIIQVLYLFTGKMNLPEGYTYAEYAREGFYQLLFVVILNTILVMVANLFFDESKGLKVLLSLMCFCTYIILSSSAFRMILYIRYYFFSFERVIVLWTLCLLAIILIGMVITIWNRKFNLFKYGIIVVTTCYIILSVSRVDVGIAKLNLKQVKGSSDFFITKEYKDYSYLAEDMPLETVDILLNDEGFMKYNPNYKATILSMEQEEKLGFRNFNFARYNAYKKVK